MKVYVAGPMRGYLHMNFPAFEEATQYLREAYGWDVVSPAELDQMDPASPTYRFADFITRDLMEINECDAIILLPGWKNSRGVAVEKAFAEAEGKSIYYYDPDNSFGTRVTAEDGGGIANVAPVTQARLFEEREREAEAWGRVGAGWKYPDTIYMQGDYVDAPLASISQAELQPDDLDAALNAALRESDNANPYTAVTAGDMVSAVRTFDTGATRSSDAGKLDYEGFLSPLVLKRFAEYMHLHRTQADGTLRGSDNWQQGIPQEQYVKSAMRHFVDWWMMHRGYTVEAPSDWRFDKDYDIMDAASGILFNVMGYLHEELKAEADAYSGF